ncbi:hypothetical protein BT93_C1437 [Corymbia citriodora subsp. variegata]|nr:hypothetical protein BT93_C1437 [Corymbia citriodora subsp. variegata]
MAESSEGRIDTSDSVHGTLYLPQPIIQEIMSRLPPRAAMQISILSKDWNHAFNTLPTLEFDKEFSESKDAGKHVASIENDAFLKYIDCYISQCHEHNLSIDSMSMPVFSKRGNKLNRLVPQWIDVASRLNLRDLTLSRIVYYPDKRWYEHKCPDLISDTISVLHVSHLSMLGIKIRLPRLEELVLHEVSESEDILNELMLSCPMLRCVELIQCTLSRDLLICEPNLETFEASGVLHSKSFSILISAPNLVSFNFTSMFTTAFTDEQLTIKEVVSRLHLLETLRLKGSRSAERIRITHKNLKHLTLTGFDSLKRVKTQTSSLVSFQYDGPNIPITGPRDSTRLANARLELDFGVRTKRRSYFKVAKFLRHFGRCDSLTLVCNEIEGVESSQGEVLEILVSYPYALGGPAPFEPQSL